MFSIVVHQGYTICSKGYFENMISRFYHQDNILQHNHKYHRYYRNDQLNHKLYTRLHLHIQDILVSIGDIVQYLHNMKVHIYSQYHQQPNVRHHHILDIQSYHILHIQLHINNKFHYLMKNVFYIYINCL